MQPIGRWGNLVVVMPAPVDLAAAKLVRGSERDFQDIVWWMRHGNIDMKALRQAANRLPESHRVDATENIVLVEVIAGMGT